MTTGTPEIGRPKKPGMGRSAVRAEGTGYGTPAPGEGYALTIAERECEKLTFEHPHDRDDVTVGVGIVAAKRASLLGRGPTLGDVRVALDYFGLRNESPVPRARTEAFLGLSHGYAAQRRFSDAVPGDVLITGENGPASAH
ncbi:MAG: hypothetical protein JWM55_392 [Acidimicrobiaceae bacterium]|nr:hypothetical protein [Acidimicrobiaceae bacterium]